jgi:PAS domain S-box-containing protein
MLLSIVDGLSNSFSIQSAMTNTTDPAHPGRDALPQAPRIGAAMRWLLVGGLAGLVIAGGYFFVRLQTQRAVREVGRQLSSIADLKYGQIAQWRHERQADVATLSVMPGLVEVLQLAGLGSQPTDSKLAALQVYFEQYCASYGYSHVVVYDSTLQPVIWNPADDLDRVVRAPDQLRTVVARGRAVVEPLHLDADGQPFIDLFCPVVLATEGGGQGIVQLRLLASAGLYDIIEAWPVSDLVGESFIVAAGAEQGLVLSKLKHRLDAPLRQQIALSGRAVETGARGPSDGPRLLQRRSYHGRSVLVHRREIPQSGWTLLLQVDERLALASAHINATRTYFTVLLMLAMIGLFATRVWRERHRKLTQWQLQTERARQEAVDRLALVLQHANDVILLVDERGTIVDINDRCRDFYGKSPYQLKGQPLSVVRAPETHDRLPQDFERALQSGGMVFETLHLHSDGHRLPVEVSARPIVVGGARYVLSVVRDVRERQQKAAEIDRITRMYQLMSHLNQSLIRIKDRDSLFREATDAMVGSGLLEVAMIVWRGAESAALRLAAHAISQQLPPPPLDFESYVPDGRVAGLVNHVLTNGRALVCGETACTSEAAVVDRWLIDAGLQCGIGLPLREGGSVAGVLLVFAATRLDAEQREIALLEESAADLSFALDVFASDARRTEIEAQLRANDAHLQTLLSSSPAIIYAMSFGQRVQVTFMSPNVEAVLGYHPQRFAGEDHFWRDRVHPDDLEATLSATRDFEHTPLIRREYRFRHADGTWRWLHDEMRLVTTDGGAAREIVGYLLDITDRRLAENKLRDREQLIDCMTSQAADAIALIDFQTGRFVEFNAAAHEGLGYGREEFSMLDVGAIQAEHSAAEIQRNFERIRLAGSVEFESKHRQRNGQLRDVRVSARLVQLGGREFISALWSDITQNKRFIAELERSRDRLARAEELACLGNWELDLVSGALTWSDQIFRIFEVEPQSFEPNYAFFLGLIHPEDRAVVDAAYQASVAQRTPYSVIHRLLFPDGRIKFVEENGRTEYATDGRALRSMGTVQDISQRRSALAEPHAQSAAAGDSGSVGQLLDIDEPTQADGGNT